MSGHGHQVGPVELVVGSEVSPLDGGARRLCRIVLDPTTRAVTHLVVEPLHGAAPGRLVPADLLEPDGRGHRLRCTSADLERLPVAQECAVPLPADHGADLLAWPYYGIGGGVGSGWGMDVQVLPREPVVVSGDLVPAGAVEVGPGEQVQAADGTAGRVRGLAMGHDHRATALLVDLGHRWAPTRAAVPMASVLAMTDVVTLDLTRTPAGPCVT